MKKHTTGLDRTRAPRRDRKPKPAPPPPPVNRRLRDREVEELTKPAIVKIRNSTGWLLVVPMSGVSGWGDTGYHRFYCPNQRKCLECLQKLYQRGVVRITCNITVEPLEDPK